MEIKFRTLAHGEGLEPTYGSELAAGADLRSAIDCILDAGQIRIIPTGLSLEIPAGYEGQVRSRSGLTLKGVIVANGVGTIDADYRGELGVILANRGLVPFEIKRGDRIAQLVVAKHEQPRYIWTTDLTDTERGEGGYGSSGK